VTAGETAALAETKGTRVTIESFVLQFHRKLRGAFV